jgi:hypothetical protein
MPPSAKAARLVTTYSPSPTAAAAIRRPGVGHMQGDGVAATVGGVGLTAPLWFEHVGAVSQFLIGVLGFVVLVLTVWNKWLEIKIKRRALQEIREADHGEGPQV